MKIVVLAGGLSPERNVSLSSGTMIAQALERLGHQVALVGMYFGLEDYDGPVASYFDAPLSDKWKRIDPQAPDMEQVKAKYRRAPGGSSILVSTVAQLWQQGAVSG